MNTAYPYARVRLLMFLCGPSFSLTVTLVE